MFNVLKLCSGFGCNFACLQSVQTAVGQNGQTGFRFITEMAPNATTSWELVTGKQLTSQTEVLLDKLTVTQLVKKFSAF
jgi:hypothetical protein